MLVEEVSVFCGGVSAKEVGNVTTPVYLSVFELFVYQFSSCTIIKAELEISRVF